MRDGKTDPRRGSPLDLNLDGGEDAEALRDGREARLYGLVRRVSIACGGHAGDESTMTVAVRLAKAAGLLIGAHPSYPDRARFGRVSLGLSPADVTRMVAGQVGLLAGIASQGGAGLVHVKPHGALYNECAKAPMLARAIADGVRAIDPSLSLVGLAGSRALDVWREAGLAVLGEAFADRGYRADGSLVPRGEPGAVLDSPETVIAQVTSLLREGRVRAVTGEWIAMPCETLCVHGDNPAAETLLRAIRARC